MHKQAKYKTYLNKLIKGAPEIEISSLFVDSREKVEDGIFFCVKGLISDGHHYVNDAIQNGAVCIIHSDELDFYAKNIHYIKVEDVLDSLNKVAAAYYNNPSHKLEVFAVTGTNGKTTVASLLKNILNKFKNAGYIGTINIEYNQKTIEANHTTPDVIELQGTLAQMVEENVESLAIEVSSHSLVQKRTQALKVDYAIYTNLTHEHLDYHGTMENYFEAKAKLFSSLDKNKHAIINIDDKFGKLMLEKSSGNNVTYAINQSADYQAVDIEYFKDATKFNLLHNDQTYPVKTNLVANFNIYNLLAIIGALNTSGIEIAAIVKHLEALAQVDGRVERIELGQKFTLIVDYAHTPDGFEKIFQYASEIKNDKKIIAVFGSAGERDILKRKVLGEIADKYCDMIILTEDDPRKENVREISNEIASEIKGNHIIIENRYDAIYQAIELANSEDIILILGKGNDQFMARKLGREYYLGDGNIAKKIIREDLLQQEEY